MRTGPMMIIPELEMELTDKLPGFECRRCSRCCQGKIIVLYRKDIERLKGIADFCEATTKKERSLTGASHKMRMQGGRCVFLKGGLCAHYELRPDTCRRHPFLVTRKNMLVATTCPGVDRSSEGRVGEYYGLSEGVGPSLDRYMSRRKLGAKGA